MKSCLIDWDLMNDNGQSYPVSPENIDALHANIAVALAYRYDLVTSVSEESSGN